MTAQDCARLQSISLAVAMAFAAIPSIAGAAQSHAPPRTRNVAIVLYAGVELLDFAGPGEVFASAGNIGTSRDVPAFHVFTVAISKEPLLSQGFLRVTPDYSIDDAPAADIVVIPGGNTHDLLANEKFLAWAIKSQAAAELTMTVCSGAFVLGKVGLLDGKSATTWYGAIDHLKTVAPKANIQEGRRFIDEGRIITTAGVSAGIDGALHVVARLLGSAVADYTAQYMEYRWSPEPYLMKSYSRLNPSFDETDRAIEDAEILELEKKVPQAIEIYRAIALRDSSDEYVAKQIKRLTSRK